jgi:hypothetical protein
MLKDVPPNIASLSQVCAQYKLSAQGSRLCWNFSRHNLSHPCRAPEFIFQEWLNVPQLERITTEVPPGFAPFRWVDS